MKREVSPMLLVGAILVGVVVIAFIGYRVWSAPSVIPAPELAKASGTVAPGAKREVSLPGGGGPTPEAMRYRDEYNRTHPEAAAGR
jgi:hypothetical protein